MIWKAPPHVASCMLTMQEYWVLVFWVFFIPYHNLFNHSKNPAIKNCRFTEPLKKVNLFLPQFYTMIPSQKDLMTDIWLQPLEPSQWLNAGIMQYLSKLQYWQKSLAKARFRETYLFLMFFIKAAKSLDKPKNHANFKIKLHNSKILQTSNTK